MFSIIILFPSYKGRMYDRCITHANYGVPWCATSTDINNQMISGKITTLFFFTHKQPGLGRPFFYSTQFNKISRGNLIIIWSQFWHFHPHFLAFKRLKVLRELKDFSGVFNLPLNFKFYITNYRFSLSFSPLKYYKTISRLYSSNRPPY